MADLRYKIENNKSREMGKNEFDAPFEIQYLKKEYVERLKGNDR